MTPSEINETITDKKGKSTWQIYPQTCLTSAHNSVTFKYAIQGQYHKKLVDSKDYQLSVRRTSIRLR